MLNLPKTIDVVALRGIYKTESKSSNISREDLYHLMIADKSQANIVIDQLYGRLPFFHQSDRTKKIYVKNVSKLNKARKKEGKSPIVYDP